MEILNNCSRWIMYPFGCYDNIDNNILLYDYIISINMNLLKLT